MWGKKKKKKEGKKVRDSKGAKSGTERMTKEKVNKRQVWKNLPLLEEKKAACSNLGKIGKGKEEILRKE